MKKVFAIVCMAVILCGIAHVAFAGGGKVRGECGLGAVNQVDFNSQDNQG